MIDLKTHRRDLMLAAVAASFGLGTARAAGVDPTKTIIKPPDQILGVSITVIQPTWPKKLHCMGLLPTRANISC